VFNQRCIGIILRLNPILMCWKIFGCGASKRCCCILIPLKNYVVLN